MSSPKRILITNDDGIDSPGIAALAQAASNWCDAQAQEFEIIVVAPAAEQSGSSGSMGAIAHQTPVKCEEVSGLAVLEGLAAHAYKVHSTPSACVILGCLGAFGATPDIVLSGINYGANCGRSVLPSGTVGAALTAANYGKSGLAVSLDVPSANCELLWEVPAQMAAELLEWLLELPARSAASLNVPNLAREEVLGLKYAPPLAPFGTVVTEFERFEDGFIHTRYSRAPGKVPEGSDRDLLLGGWAVLCPLQPPTLDLDVPPPDGALATGV